MNRGAFMTDGLASQGKSGKVGMIGTDALLDLLRTGPEIGLIGVDGLPASGKSTLADRLVEVEPQARGTDRRRVAAPAQLHSCVAAAARQRSAAAAVRAPEHPLEALRGRDLGLLLRADRRQREQRRDQQPFS